MPSPLLGTRIRERRESLGLKQAELARQAGISPSYLNLIEHNRRGIAGRVLIEIAGLLGLEVQALTEGVDAELLRKFRQAAASSDRPVEDDKLEEMIGRFPGWSQLFAGLVDRSVQLEHMVEGLSDRLAHDPFLSETLHEMLSSVTAIRSTSSILTQSEKMKTLQQRRFQANIHQESGRLSELSQGLVSYFDMLSEGERSVSTPLDEVEGFLTDYGYHFEELESGDAEPIGTLLVQSSARMSQASREMAKAVLEQYVRDARLIPGEAFRDILSEIGSEPIAIAAKFGVPLDTVYRRLAFWRPMPGMGNFGLIVCDATGATLVRKPQAGFPLPRYGPGCSLWPLYQAITRPHFPVSALLETPEGGLFHAEAYAAVVGVPSAAQPPVIRSTMIFRHSARDGTVKTSAPAILTGQSCRVCPRLDCHARREPSIHASGA